MIEQIPGRTRSDRKPVVAVALIRNRLSVPSFLTSTRLSGLDSGDETLFGGRMQAGETVTETAVRESLEEVGVYVRDPSIFWGVDDPPVWIETRAGSRNLHIIFAYYDQFRSFGRIRHKEKQKNTPWVWRSLTEIDHLVKAQYMHPAFLERFWMKEAELCPRIVRGMPIEAYDFPHYPLHTTQQLHENLRPVRYPRSSRFPI